MTDDDNPRQVPYTFRLSDLPKLDLQVDKGTDFTAWHTQWECYCNLSGLAGQAAEKQVEAFNLCLSRETLAIVQNLGLTNAEKKDIAAIIQACKGMSTARSRAGGSPSPTTTAHPTQYASNLPRVWFGSS